MKTWNWHKLSEETPEAYASYIVCTSDGLVWVSDFNGRKNWIVTESILKDVTHWAELPGVPKKDNLKDWIPKSEKMPTEDSEYLVVYTDGFIDLCFYEPGVEDSDWNCDWEDVEYWMMYPELPKEYDVSKYAEKYKNGE